MVTESGTCPDTIKNISLGGLEAPIFWLFQPTITMQGVLWHVKTQYLTKLNVFSFLYKQDKNMGAN